MSVLDHHFFMKWQKTLKIEKNTISKHEDFCDNLSANIAQRVLH